MLNIMRNKFEQDKRYLPYLLNDFSYEKIKNGKMLFLIAPTMDFTTSEVNDIVSFVENGGLLVLSIGFSDKKASNKILSEFELDILSEPLGPIPYIDENPNASENEPRFVDSWPVISEGNDENTFIYYNVAFGENTKNLVIFKKIMNGGVLLIGDSQFLLDNNIESLNDYWPGNIEFLRNMFDEIENQGVPK